MPDYPYWLDQQLPPAADMSPGVDPYDPGAAPSFAPPPGPMGAYQPNIYAYGYPPGGAYVNVQIPTDQGVQPTGEDYGTPLYGPADNSTPGTMPDFWVNAGDYNDAGQLNQNVADPYQYDPSSYAGIATPDNPDLTPSLPATQAPDTGPDLMAEGNNYFPNGQGGYWVYDTNWNWIGNMPGQTGGQPGQVASAPAQPTFPITWGGDTGPIYANPGGRTGNFGQDLKADLGDIGNFFGANQPGTTYAPFGVSPSGIAAAAGHPMQALPGSFAGLGQGSHGQLAWNYYGRMGMDALRKGRDSTLGFEGFKNVNANGPVNFANPAAFAQMAQFGEASSKKPTGTAGITSGGGPGGIA